MLRLVKNVSSPNSFCSMDYVIRLPKNICILYQFIERLMHSFDSFVLLKHELFFDFNLILNMIKNHTWSLVSINLWKVPNITIFLLLLNSLIVFSISWTSVGAIKVTLYYSHLEDSNLIKNFIAVLLPDFLKSFFSSLDHINIRKLEYLSILIYINDHGCFDMSETVESLPRIVFSYRKLIQVNVFASQNSHFMIMINL